MAAHCLMKEEVVVDVLVESPDNRYYKKTHAF